MVKLLTFQLVVLQKEYLLKKHPFIGSDWQLFSHFGNNLQFYNSTFYR